MQRRTRTAVSHRRPEDFLLIGGWVYQGKARIKKAPLLPFLVFLTGKRQAVIILMPCQKAAPSSCHHDTRNMWVKQPVLRGQRQRRRGSKKEAWWSERKVHWSSWKGCGGQKRRFVGQKRRVVGQKRRVAGVRKKDCESIGSHGQDRRSDEEERDAEGEIICFLSVERARVV